MNSFHPRLILLLALPLLLLPACKEETVIEYQATEMMVSGVYPAVGPTAGGTPVTIYGTLFSGTPTVTIGGAAATSVTLVSDTQITCTTPAGTAGAQDVVVSGVTLVGGFTYAGTQAQTWTRRAPITVTGQDTVALTHYQIQIVLPYDTDMNADFSDLRFTVDDGAAETDIPYWVESSTASTDATVWVKLPSIPASPGTTTVYVYYGNPLAASDSDFDAVFTKDFEETGLLGLWHLDEGYGMSSLDDSPFSNTAYLYHLGAPYGWIDEDGGQWADRFDVGFSSGSGLAFNGESSFVDCGNHGSLDVGKSFSLEAWVKGNDPLLSGAQQTIAGRWGMNNGGFTNLNSWRAFDPGRVGSVNCPNLPANRVRHASVELDGKIYVIGGDTGGGTALNSLFMYDPETNTWTTKAPMSVSRHSLAACTLNGKIYAMCGINGGGLSNVEEYDPSLDSWTTKASAPITRYYAGAQAVNGKIYIFGGHTSAGTYSNRTEVYDPVTNTWNDHATAPLANMNTGRIWHASCVLNNEIWVIGGYLSGSYLSLVEAYDPVGDAWQVKTPCPSIRTWSSAASLNGKLYVFGGYNGSTTPTPDVIEFNPSGGGWTTKPSLITARESATGAKCGNRIYITGGWGSYNSMEVYTVGLDDQGLDPDSYSGGVFDGRYIYYAPWQNGATYHDLFLRFDTTGEFYDQAAWTAWNSTLGVYGFEGGVFDGRYVYFVPGSDSSGPHGRVLQYDTQGAFDQSTSWKSYDPGSQGLGTDPDGYCGAAFDGKYIYFSPRNNGTENHGEVLRYDTTQDFRTLTSWATYDPGANGVGNDPDGFLLAQFDGRYVYFCPYDNGTALNAEFLRYDTTHPFDLASSWTTYDPGTAGLAAGVSGYYGMTFDGRYLYAVPWYNGVQHTQMLRYDTKAPFQTLASWTMFDPRTVGVGTQAGFHGAMFDGRYVYASPMGDCEVYRYDTRKEFSSAQGWTAYDPNVAGLGTNPHSFKGATFDGRYFYFHTYGGTGEFMRYDTTGSAASFKLSYGTNDGAGGNAGQPFGFTGIVSTTDGAFSVSSNTPAAENEWHHVVVTYYDDELGAGTELNLYVDGALVKTTAATGIVAQNLTPMQIGAMESGASPFHGEIDEVRLYNRALAAGEVAAHYQRRKYSASAPLVSAVGTEETR